MKERFFTSASAYRAAIDLIDIASQRLRSDNLTMLLSTMELLPYGDSADPALLGDWKHAWGDVREKNEKDTLLFISQFIVEHGKWDEDDQGPEIVRAGIEQFVDRGDVSDPVMQDWKTAVWREGNRYRKS